mmetsp:Transcript_56397/g.115389  ORF Transcript_56397/g.115389 Transcript_56397/m.115389 type:complete len:283 (+) Transcript_56397:410-1258(+)
MQSLVSPPGVDLDARQCLISHHIESEGCLHEAADELDDLVHDLAHVHLPQRDRHRRLPLLLLLLRQFEHVFDGVDEVGAGGDEGVELARLLRRRRRVRVVHQTLHHACHALKGGAELEGERREKLLALLCRLLQYSDHALPLFDEGLATALRLAIRLRLEGAVHDHRGAPALGQEVHQLVPDLFRGDVNGLQRGKDPEDRHRDPPTEHSNPSTVQRPAFGILLERVAVDGEHQHLVDVVDHRDIEEEGEAKVDEVVRHDAVACHRAEYDHEEVGEECEHNLF